MAVKNSLKWMVEELPFVAWALIILGVVLLNALVLVGLSGVV